MASETNDPMLSSTAWAEERSPLREAQDALSHANIQLSRMLTDFTTVTDSQTLTKLHDQLRTELEKSSEQATNPNRLGAWCERYLSTLTNPSNEKVSAQPLDPLPRLAYTREGIEEFWDVGVWKVLLKAFSAGFFQIISPVGDESRESARERRDVWERHWKELEYAAFRMACVEDESLEAVRMRSMILRQFAQKWAR